MSRYGGGEALEGYSLTDNKLVFLGASEGCSSLPMRGAEGGPGSSHGGAGRFSLSESASLLGHCYRVAAHMGVFENKQA